MDCLWLNRPVAWAYKGLNRLLLDLPVEFFDVPVSLETVYIPPLTDCLVLASFGPRLPASY
jgi:hypothetical protein